MDVILRVEIVDLAKGGEKCVFTGTLIVVPDVSQLGLPGSKPSAIRDNRNTRGDDAGGNGVSGLKALGVRDLTYRMAFLACMVTPDTTGIAEGGNVLEIVNTLTQSNTNENDQSVEEIQAGITKLGESSQKMGAAMYAADKSDRIASLKVKIRENQANKTIWSFAVFKATVVALNGVPGADVLGGGAVDVAMVRALAHIYGIEMNWSNMEKLVGSILKAAGWVTLSEITTHAISWSVKAVTLGWGTVLTMVPQGAAAGYGSYIVGQAAKYYFEHGASWGNEGPKTVIRRILEKTDKRSVLDGLKQEIQTKLNTNRHSGEGK
jgi:uncharacterized protein (DUF697 family)